MIEENVLTLAVIALAAFLSQWLAWKVKLPAILFLLITGLILGPLTGILNPSELFGEMEFPLISLAVAVILFEGGLTLNFEQIRGSTGAVRRLILGGALITWVSIALVSYWLFSLPWVICVLFGAIMVVTGPTVIAPLLRTVRPDDRIANILRWEGIIIDPLGALFAVVTFEFLIIAGQSEAIGHGIVQILRILASGFGFGIAAGAILAAMLKRHWVPEYMENLCALALVFFTFAISNIAAEEAGLLAVTVMGMWIANQKDIHISEVLSFKEHLSVVLISGLFIILAARLSTEQLLALGWMPFVLLALIQFVIRPLAVFATTWGSELNLRQKALLAWIAPRGIVAAAVSALFAIRLEEAGVPQADMLVSLSFAMILGTVIWQSTTSRALAKLLKVTEPAPKGVLIFGANTVARTIGKALTDQNVKTLLCDSNWRNIKTARMDGLETFYGNPASDYADHHLSLTGLGSLLSISPDTSANAVAGMRYKSNFGRNHVYNLHVSDELNASEKFQPAQKHRGQVLFGEQVTYDLLRSRLREGHRIRVIRVSEDYQFEDIQKEYNEECIVLFKLNEDGDVEIVTDETKIDWSDGERLLVMTPAEGQSGRDNTAKPRLFY